MLGWGIVLLVCIVIFIVSFIAFYNDWFYLDELWLFLGFFTGVITAILILVCIVNPLIIKENINEFKMYQELVEITYSEEDKELNYAMNVQVIKMNKWLANVKSKEEVYGIFSFYRGKIDDLEYIEIGD
jgi:energy-coupling factor transporter transmembrane protein EcfT